MELATSVFLAKVIGLFAVISTAAYVRPNKMFEIEREATQNRATVVVSGFVILLLGILIVVAHPVWTIKWPVMITIIGCLLLIKGIGRIFWPEAVAKLIARKAKNRFYLLGEVTVFLVGVYLIYHGFFDPYY